MSEEFIDGCVYPGKGGSDVEFIVIEGGRAPTDKEKLWYKVQDIEDESNGKN